MQSDLDKLKRRLLIFQKDILAFGNNHYELLKDDIFICDISKYVNRLYQLRRFENLASVLGKLSYCAVRHEDVVIRERALLLLSYFAGRITGKNRLLFYIYFSGIYHGWLIHESSYHQGFEYISVRLVWLLKKLLELRLWIAAEKLILALYQIRFGYLGKNDAFKRLILNAFWHLPEERIFKKLIKAYLHGDTEIQEVTGCILLHIGDMVGSQLISELFENEVRENRLLLIDIISEESPVILPVIMKHLNAKQPWYVLRNILVLLGRMRDPDLYFLVKPFIFHPDQRVKKQVIHSVRQLGGERVAERLLDLETLSLCTELFEPTLDIEREWTAI